MKKFILLGIFVITCLPEALSNSQIQQLYFECDGCTADEMRQEAASTWIAGRRAEAHVFNESNRQYMKFRVYKRIMGTGHETWTNITASPSTPNQSVMSSFLDLIDKKRALELAIKNKYVEITEDGEAVVHDVSELGSDSSGSSPKQNVINLEEALAHSVRTGDPLLPDRCSSPRPVSNHDYTAVKWLGMQNGKAALFDVITHGFELTSVGNMPEFFAANKKFFDALEATGARVAAQTGALLSVIGKDSNEIQVKTPDNGEMFVTLNFRGQGYAEITFAVDGNCNEIPLTEEDLYGEYIFTADNNPIYLENYISARFGTSFIGNFGSTSGGICGVKSINCSYTEGGDLLGCTRRCLSRN